MEGKLKFLMKSRFNQGFNDSKTSFGLNNLALKSVLSEFRVCRKWVLALRRPDIKSPNEKNIYT